MRRLALLAIVVLGAALPARADRPPSMWSQDPMGLISDVSGNAAHYQPATDFCILPNTFEGTGDQQINATGDDCQPWFPAGTVLKYYKLHIETPPLCPGCRRLFIDYSKIPATNSPPNYYARGHVYYHLDSMNPSYTMEPIAHSPNTKNFSNDKLVVPAGSPQEEPVWGFDLHAIAYTGDTLKFSHAKIQGPWYTGPAYVNSAGEWINGVYLDVNVGDATPAYQPIIDSIGYVTGFNNGEATCPDNVLFGGAYQDGNYFYGSCVNWWGSSTGEVNPF